jgi:hypothetical protein
MMKAIGSRRTTAKNKIHRPGPQTPLSARVQPTSPCRRIRRLYAQCLPYLILEFALPSPRKRQRP